MHEPVGLQMQTTPLPSTTKSDGTKRNSVSGVPKTLGRTMKGKNNSKELITYIDLELLPQGSG